MKKFLMAVVLVLFGLAQAGEKTSDGRPTNKPGVAGFSREKTLEMMEFNRWRNQTPEGRAWDQRQRQQYRYPGDPREDYEDRFIYKGPGIDNR
jgi:hypothetical protein